MEEFGKDWEDCYMEFTLITPEESQKVKEIVESQEDEKMLSFIESKFVSGKGFSEGKQVDIVKEDLRKEIPTTFLAKCLLTINGQVSPN